MGNLKGEKRKKRDREDSGNQQFILRRRTSPIWYDSLDPHREQQQDIFCGNKVKNATRKGYLHAPKGLLLTDHVKFDYYSNKRTLNTK